MALSFKNRSLFSELRKYMSLSISEAAIAHMMLINNGTPKDGALFLTEYEENLSAAQVDTLALKIAEANHPESIDTVLLLARSLSDEAYKTLMDQLMKAPDIDSDSENEVQDDIRTRAASLMWQAVASDRIDRATILQWMQEHGFIKELSILKVIEKGNAGDCLQVISDLLDEESPSELTKVILTKVRDRLESTALQETMRSSNRLYAAQSATEILHAEALMLHHGFNELDIDATTRERLSELMLKHAPEQSLLSFCEWAANSEESDVTLVSVWESLNRRFPDATDRNKEKASLIDCYLEDKNLLSSSVVSRSDDAMIPKSGVSSAPIN